MYRGIDARVLVEFNLSIPKPERILVKKKHHQNYNHFEFYVDIEVESMPRFCVYYRTIGHKMNYYKRRGLEDIQLQSDSSKVNATELYLIVRRKEQAQQDPGKLDRQWMQDETLSQKMNFINQGLKFNHGTQFGHNNKVDDSWKVQGGIKKNCPGPINVHRERMFEADTGSLLALRIRIDHGKQKEKSLEKKA